MFRCICFLLFSLASLLRADDYLPKWGQMAPARTIRMEVTGDSPAARGEELVRAVAGLKPGDCLVIPAGTYSVERLWDIQVSGTAKAPVWITAGKNAVVIITRPDAKQNVINVGHGKPVEYLCLRGLEITGGSHGVRLGQCRNVWVDGCHIHHTGGVCLSANSANTDHLYITRNHIHHSSGHAEGLYLGGNDASVIMSESVIAQNHIHDCYGQQGDGIEVKQGSWGNLIAMNDVHDTNYPCITVYGTAGKPRNIIERNLCRNSRDNVMQVQGEAVVRNNILINGGGAAFASMDHQGKTLNLEVIHNTLINTGHAFRGNSWNDRRGMVLANNMICSRDGNALHFPGGSKGVIITGNVLSGAGEKFGNAAGSGLADFAAVTWDGTRHDVSPVAGAKAAVPDPKYVLAKDFYGKPRGPRATPGAVAQEAARRGE